MVSVLKIPARAALTGLALAALIAAPIEAAPPLIAVPALPAPAAKPANTPRIYLSADGETVYIIGAIMDDSFLRFDALLQGAARVKTVFLASPGGLTLEGRLIAALVRKRKLNTYVEQYCASACTQVFVAGRERVIGPEGELGFHQAVGVDTSGETSAIAAASTRKLSPITVFGLNGNDTLRLAYEQAGIDQPFIAKALARGHEDMWVPTPAELSQSHVITRRADHTEVALPEGSHSRAQIRAMLEVRPMWRAAATALPEAYALGLNDAWRRANTGSDVGEALSSGRASIVIAAWPLLAAASDTLIDRMLSLYADSARGQRARSYPMCKETLDEAAAPIDPMDSEFEATEDQLLIELFNSPVRVAALSADDARKTFERDVVPIMIRSYLATNLKSTSASCRLGFQIFEAIDQLPGKKRIKAYRALLSLPEMGAG
jgi:hypothetical protein